MIGPHSAALAAQLPDLGDGIAAAMGDLARDPAPDKAEMMAIKLDNARRHCQLLADAMRQECSQERGNGP